jgi:hypothetical protein
MVPLRNRVKENSRLLPQYAIDIMTKWYEDHYTNPYPTYRECEILAEAGMVSINQVKQWFVNVRRRSQNEFRRKRAAKTSRSTKRDCDSSSKSSSDDSSILNEINILSEQLNAIQNENRAMKNIVAPIQSSSYVNQNASAYLNANYYNNFYNPYNSPQVYGRMSTLTSTPNTQVFNNYSHSSNDTSTSNNLQPRFDYNNFYSSYNQSYNSFY